MNEFYGFKTECEKKLGLNAFSLISKVFEYMPIGHIICKKVLVLHGGISPKPGMTLRFYQNMNRVKQPSEDEPLNDILWSDPLDNQGAQSSYRGGAVLFGPDKTEQFLQANNLELLIRSHQVVQEGNRIHHNGKCVTVFSAPNYIGKVGNLGCVATVSFEDGKLLPVKYTHFKAKPIPFDFEPMIYADLRNFA